MRSTVHTSWKHSYFAWIQFMWPLHMYLYSLITVINLNSHYIYSWWCIQPEKMSCSDYTFLYFPKRIFRTFEARFIISDSFLYFVVRNFKVGQVNGNTTTTVYIFLALRYLSKSVNKYLHLRTQWSQNLLMFINVTIVMSCSIYQN